MKSTKKYIWSGVGYWEGSLHIMLWLKNSAKSTNSRVFMHRSCLSMWFWCAYVSYLFLTVASWPFLKRCRIKGNCSCITPSLQFTHSPKIYTSIYGAPTIFQTLCLALGPNAVRTEFWAWVWESSLHGCQILFQTHGPHYQQCFTFVEQCIVFKPFFPSINYISWPCSACMLEWDIMIPVLKEKDIIAEYLDQYFGYMVMWK